MLERSSAGGGCETGEPVRPCPDEGPVGWEMGGSSREHKGRCRSPGVLSHYVPQFGLGAPACPEPPRLQGRRGSPCRR